MHEVAAAALRRSGLRVPSLGTLRYLRAALRASDLHPPRPFHNGGCAVGVASRRRTLLPVLAGLNGRALRGVHMGQEQSISDYELVAGRREEALAIAQPPRPGSIPGVELAPNERQALQGLLESLSHHEDVRRYVYELVQTGCEPNMYDVLRLAKALAAHACLGEAYKVVHVLLIQSPQRADCRLWQDESVELARDCRHIMAACLEIAVKANTGDDALQELLNTSRSLGLMDNGKLRVAFMSAFANAGLVTQARDLYYTYGGDQGVRSRMLETNLFIRLLGRYGRATADLKRIEEHVMASVSPAPHRDTLNSLVSAYLYSAAPDEALRMFRSAHERSLLDAYAYNKLINYACAHDLGYSSASGVYRMMQTANIRPTEHTFAPLLFYLARKKYVIRFSSVMREMMRHNVDPGAATFAAVVKLLLRNRLFSQIGPVLRLMEAKNVPINEFILLQVVSFYKRYHPDASAAQVRQMLGVKNKQVLSHLTSTDVIYRTVDNRTVDSDLRKIIYTTKDLKSAIDHITACVSRQGSMPSARSWGLLLRSLLYSKQHELVLSTVAQAREANVEAPLELQYYECLAQTLGTDATEEASQNLADLLSSLDTTERVKRISWALHCYAIHGSVEQQRRVVRLAYATLRLKEFTPELWQEVLCYNRQQNNGRRTISALRYLVATNLPITFHLSRVLSSLRHHAWSPEHAGQIQRLLHRYGVIQGRVGLGQLKSDDKSVQALSTIVEQAGPMVSDADANGAHMRTGGDEIGRGLQHGTERA